MKQLKQGTPVWYNLLHQPCIGIINGELTDTYILGELVGCRGSRISKTGVNPLTIQHYIEYVMVPQGWEYQSKRVFRLTLKNQSTLWISSVNTSGDSVDYYPSITGNGKEIKYTSVDLRKLEQALTHCQRLNILKELEI